MDSTSAKGRGDPWSDEAIAVATKHESAPRPAALLPRHRTVTPRPA